MALVRKLSADGWDVALRALGKLKDARRIPSAELLLNVEPPSCDLVGVPKPVLPAPAGLSTGATIALSDGVVRVNYIARSSSRRMHLPREEGAALPAAACSGERSGARAV